MSFDFFAITAKHACNVAKSCSLFNINFFYMLKQSALMHHFAQTSTKNNVCHNTRVNHLNVLTS